VFYFGLMIPIVSLLYQNQKPRKNAQNEVFLFVPIPNWEKFMEYCVKVGQLLLDSVELTRRYWKT